MILELLKNKSYFLLLLASILFLVLFLTIDKNERFVINIYDTYYVAEFQHGFVILFVMFLTTGLFYLICDYFKIKIISILSLSHVYSSLITIGLFFYYLDKVNSSSIFNSIDYNFRINISLLIFIILQFIFVINLITSIIKKLRNLALQ